MTFPELMERYQVLEGHSSEPRIYSGFQGTVDVGWIPLLEDLLGELVALGWDRRLDQVKQKFGGLRFYAGSTTTEMDAAIDRAEARASRTCERCGRPGVPRDGGWIKTLCDVCADGRPMPEDP